MKIAGIPNTKHVRSVAEKAEEVGLTLDRVTGRYGQINDFSKGAEAWFKKDRFVLHVTFDRRGYIVQAGGSSPDSNSWVISVSNSRRFPCSPARALEVLVNFTMPRYAEVAA